MKERNEGVKKEIEKKRKKGKEKRKGKEKGLKGKKRCLSNGGSIGYCRNLNYDENMLLHKLFL